MKEFLNTIERIWCETMHDRVMWPIHGRYLCSTCLREYPVAFDFNTKTQRRGESHASHVYASASADGR